MSEPIDPDKLDLAETAIERRSRVDQETRDRQARADAVKEARAARRASGQTPVDWDDEDDDDFDFGEDD